MYRTLRKLAIVACAAAALSATRIAAQTCATGWAHVVATKIQSIDRTGSGTPNLIPSGTFTIGAQNGNLQPTSFSIPGGGIATMVPRARALANGALVQTLCVPRSDLTTPQVGYDITVRDTSPAGGNAVVIHLTSVAINQAEWSFDDYLITTPQPWHMFAGLAPVPTGTGYAHVTGGTLDTTAQLVDLSRDVTGLLPWNKITGAPSGGGGGGGGGSFYQYVENGDTTLDQQGTLKIDNTGGLEAVNDPANNRTIARVDGTHYLPANNRGVCLWNGNGACITLHPSDLAPDFTSTGWSCGSPYCGTYQPGQPNGGNPTFTIGYVGGFPTAGSVSDNTSNPAIALPGPHFDSVTLPYTYTLNAPGQVCFTLSTTPATSTSPICSTWQWLTYSGLTSGAPTGATASSSTALTITSGATGTLNALGYGVETGTWTFTPSSSGQYIVFLTLGSSHTFKVNGFSATFTKSTVSLANFYGMSVSYTANVSPAYYIYPTTVEMD